MFGVNFIYLFFKLSSLRRYYLNLVLVDEEERRYFKQQEITLWRKGERQRKLPLGNALYQQQQHALARHAAGDHPTQGVRTAPTPSEPPTPYSDTAKPLPGHHEEVQESDRPAEDDHEEAEASPADDVGDNDNQDSDERVAATEDDDQTAVDTDLAQETADKCSVSGDNVSNPPDLVSHVPASVTSGAGDTGAEAETDSLADLDIVAVSDAREPPDNMTVPDDSLDSPPEMPDTPDDESPVSSPVISLPDAPNSEPGSPELKVSHNLCSDVVSTILF